LKSKIGPISTNKVNNTYPLIKAPKAALITSSN